MLKKDTKTKSTTSRSKTGRVYIASSYNNTLMTLTDQHGNVLSWSTAGNIGFKGSKKATPFAAAKVAETIVKTAEKIGVSEVEVYVKGIGGGRDSAIRSLAAKGLEILSIKDVTPVPHNGCRKKKPRRV
ncbi:MAG: 30S ribosomal protein S11 [bacterium]